jgi:pimeloyl-ACP methyl ester carboxylesterase
LNRTVRAKPANEGQIATLFTHRLPRLIQFLGPACLLACTLSAQVASPTGQSNSKQPPAATTQSAPSALAPRLNTSKPGPPQSTAEVEPPPVPVQTETGQLDGASYRIDIPQNWNHSLVIYFHGYEAKPKTFEQQHPPGRILQQVLNRGFAVAQSGYSTGGWAVARALHETDAVRSRFVHEHGNPRETYVMGHSMGGLMTVMALEQHPDTYAGGLALCGVLAPADLVMQRAFANRVAFDAFFPGILPDVDHIPDSFMIRSRARARAPPPLACTPR